MQTVRACRNGPKACGVRGYLTRVTPTWLFALTLLAGCYESHGLTPPPEPPEEARLIGARYVDGDTVIETKELGGDVVELTRFPTDFEPRTLSVSPDQGWLLVQGAVLTPDVLLLNLETREHAELVWSVDRAPCETIFRSVDWSGPDSILLSCGRNSSSPEYFVAGLDGVVRRLEVPPECEVRGHGVGSGLLLSRCDDGDYVINARGDRLSTIRGMPPLLLITDYNTMIVSSASSVTAYLREDRGSRFWRWSEDSPERGHFVPLLVVDDDPYWFHPYIAPGGSVSAGHGSLSGVESDDHVYDPFRGTPHETCVEEERWLSFSPARSHILVSCPDLTTYLNVATGRAETIPTDVRLFATFSRDATRFIGYSFRDHEVYDHSLGAWVDSWPGMNDVAWLYPAR